MISKTRMTALAATMALGISGSGIALGAEFSDSQRDEIGTIVRDYLLQNPEVLRDAFQELERRQRQSEADAAQQSIGDKKAQIFRAEGDLVVGNPQGSVTLVEFFDYNCGYCKRAMPDLLKLIESDKDLRVVMKEFPILGPGSLVAARASLASQKQGKNWEFHKALIANRGSVTEARVFEIAAETGLDVDKLKADMQAPEVDAVLKTNFEIADALGINGTPAFLIDDQLIPGAVGYAALSRAVAGVRESGGCKVC